MTETIKNIFQYSEIISNVVKGTVVTDKDNNIINLDDAIRLSIDLLIKTDTSDKNIIISANGGSAAIASHLQNDLVKACKLRSMVFTEQPLLTAISNDLGYEHAYEIPLSVWGKKGDVFIAISSSGESKNIINAVQVAKKKLMTIITYSGFNEDNPLRRLGDLNFYSKFSEYGIIENSHSILTHYITDEISKKNRSD